MANNSIYGSTKELMTSSDVVERGGSDQISIMGHKRSKRGLLNRQKSCNSFDMSAKKIDQGLTPEEKRFILLVERGDTATVAKTITLYQSKPQVFDINCMDPLGRSGLSIAIMNENPEMMDLLLNEGISVADALLLAISEEYVEGVELLLLYEERNHVGGTPYSWEAVDHVSANYTPDITPLILAAHKNNYEILKILLDRGASLPTPHDLKCSCDSCITASQEDSLRFSLSRINAYRALASPSLISLTSSDPILTAFQLSDELKKLKKMESQFCAQYSELRLQVQQFATNLLDHARTSYELEIMLNYDIEGDIWDPGETQTLHRLKLALKCKQKAFVAHPNVQQLVATIWYEGLPGWRRMNVIGQTIELLHIGLMFPVHCIAYMLVPGSERGVFMKNPFVKFIAHSASYMCFLLLLAAASQRVELIILDFLGEYFDIELFNTMVDEWHRHERGSFPSPIECLIIFWVFALIWKEVKEIHKVGLVEYLCDLWNLADCFTNMCFVGWIMLRLAAFILVKREEMLGINPYYPREEWHAYDPYLISEGLFGAGMITSFLKLVHIFSINPHLGPLQISLGRMAVDIAKFLVLFLLVLFAFGCGMNQLLWYYADLEYNKCYSLPGGLPDVKNHGNSCIVWRRFANLFETSQSLFWASFGLVSLTDFELTGIKEFTRFWALLMFGSYSVCNIIVLLNMLIAMMSNSFQIISERSDTEWKFSRTKLWISYFETGSTVPPPFNIIPTGKSIGRLLGCCTKEETVSNKEKEVATKRYNDVMKCIVRRYITSEQKKAEDFAITEDDVSEIRQDINKFRYEMIDILRNNKFVTPEVSERDVFVSNKRAKQTERRIRKGFNISTVDVVIKEAFNNNPHAKEKDFFKVIAKAIGNNANKDWNSEVQSRVKVDHIGSSRTFAERRMASYRKTVLARGGSQDDLNKMNAEELVDFNPRLRDFTPHTRLAYAKFKSLGKLAKVSNDGRAELTRESSQSSLTTSLNETMTQGAGTHSGQGLRAGVGKAKRFERLMKTTSSLSMTESIKELDESVKSPTKSDVVRNVGEKLDNLIELSPGIGPSEGKKPPRCASQSDKVDQENEGSALKAEQERLTKPTNTTSNHSQAMDSKTEDHSPRTLKPSPSNESLKSLRSLSKSPKSDSGSLVGEPEKSPKGSGNRIAPTEIVTPQPSPLPNVPSKRKKSQPAPKLPAPDDDDDDEYPSGEGETSPPKLSVTRCSVDQRGEGNTLNPDCEDASTRDNEPSPLPSPAPRSGKGVSVVSGSVRSGWL
eukprot:snap_masked-scaffold474_size162001-processed-gene-0.5 protein:Tk10280 transcript:snap_masked-scaffold474_size162001-processed-gene-0.5-mRNA-1 annotation:"trp channel protein"